MVVQNFSLDIETLGSVGSPVVLSIGLYHMKDEIEEEPDPRRLFVANIDITSSLKAGLTVEGSNLRWWFEQSDEARQALFKPQPSDLTYTIKTLGEWYRRRIQSTIVRKDEVRVWSHSTFDIPVLNNACKAVRLDMPWSPRDTRDLRTIVDGLELTELKKGHPLEHTCGWDAFAQGQQVLEALKIKDQYKLWIASSNLVLSEVVDREGWSVGDPITNPEVLKNLYGQL